MTSFKNLMVHYNRNPGDQSALENAIQMARIMNATLAIVETVPEESIPGTRVLDERRAHLQRFSSAIRAEGIKVRAALLHGDPLKEMTREVMAHGIDLLFISDFRPGSWWPLGRRALAHSLVRQCPCDILVNSSERQPGDGGILAALTLKDDEDSRSLDRKVLAMAHSLATRTRRELHILHAWDFLGREREKSRSELTLGTLHQMERKSLEGLQLKLGTLLEETGTLRFRSSQHFRRGPAVPEITKFMEDHEIALSIMGYQTPARGFGFWRDSVTEDVLRAGTKSQILAVKAPDFRSTLQEEIQGDHLAFSNLNAA